MGNFLLKLVGSAPAACAEGLFHVDSPFSCQEAVPGDAEMEDEDYEDENWGNLEGEVITVELEQNNYGLGLSLAGAKVQDFKIFYIPPFSQTLKQYIKHFYLVSLFFNVSI